MPVAPLDPERWRDSADYLHGVDLFNHGYYWEAHEAWEGLWMAAGRRGPTASLLQGLIQLAAAGVKVRQGMPGGVRALAARAAGTLVALEAESWRGARAPGEGAPGGPPAVPAEIAGFAPAALVAFARRVAERAERWPRPPAAATEPVFDRWLAPGRDGGVAPVEH